MTGTIVNAAGIILGSLIGVAINKGLSAEINAAIIKAEGIGVSIIALNGVIASMFKAGAQTGRLSDSGSLLLIISLVLGCVAGEFLRLEDRLNMFGQNMEKRFGVSGFAKGFVSGSLLFPIGAMAFIGAIKDGLTGDSSVLYMKTLLDTITSVVLASALGFGVLFSSVSVFILQGTVSLLAKGIEPLITEAILDSFCMVGYAIVLAIGINFITDAKIKVANLLPSLAVPIFYYCALAII